MIRRVRRTGPGRRLWAAALAATMLPVLAACSGGEQAVRAPDPVEHGALINVVRNGGRPFRDESAMVLPDGSWRTYRGGRDKASGTLTAQQQAQLTALLTDPRLRDEGRQSHPPTSCPDAFRVWLYVVHPDRNVTIGYAECPDAATPPVAAGIANLLMDATDWVGARAMAAAPAAQQDA
ncbi:hypothetical protein Cci01nite_37740 [Catellatospora citrea]|uniref:Lipoprotein n=2 Tax=Catellatospora citrea TaxID=53366 RepID=A0A8J3NZT0_9ACTN|nr:hypothetical protein C8E86_1506 [Catellatospora citrea]GIF98680.1 hypothetical protein Cci01nite_37740 [Catellatospora citrea]